jgi:hypothetical protein
MQIMRRNIQGCTETGRGCRGVRTTSRAVEYRKLRKERTEIHTRDILKVKVGAGEVVKAA